MVQHRLCHFSRVFRGNIAVPNGTHPLRQPLGMSTIAFPTTDIQDPATSVALTEKYLPILWPIQKQEIQLYVTSHNTLSASQIAQRSWKLNRIAIATFPWSYIVPFPLYERTFVGRFKLGNGVMKTSRKMSDNREPSLVNQEPLLTRIFRVIFIFEDFVQSIPRNSMFQMHDCDNFEEITNCHCDK